MNKTIFLFVIFILLLCFCGKGKRPSDAGPLVTDQLIREDSLSRIPNTAPVFTTVFQKIDTLVVGYMYNRPFSASDAQGNALSYFMVADTNRARIYADTNIFAVNADSVSKKPESLYVIAEDEMGLSDTLLYRYLIINHPPVFKNLPADMKDSIAVSAMYTDTLKATDADSHNVYYSLIQGPASMLCTTLSGIIAWTPTIKDTGKYQIIAKAYDGYGGRDTLEWQVVCYQKIAPVIITTQPIAQTVTVAQSVTFSVVATGTAPLSYQWKKNGTNISGATSSSYTISSTVAGDTGSYAVVVTNRGGNVTSNAAVLSVYGFPNPAFIGGKQVLKAYLKNRMNVDTGNAFATFKVVMQSNPSTVRTAVVKGIFSKDSLAKYYFLSSGCVLVATTTSETLLVFGDPANKALPDIYVKGTDTVLNVEIPPTSGSGGTFFTGDKNVIINMLYQGYTVGWDSLGIFITVTVAGDDIWSIWDGNLMANIVIAQLSGGVEWAFLADATKSPMTRGNTLVVQRR
jgi:hypothetical protein